MSVTRPPNPQRVGSAADPAAAYRQLVAARRRNRRWRGGLVALAVIVVGLAVATAAISVANHAVHGGASHHSSAPPAAATSSSTTTTTTPGTGNGPTITAISPNSGAPGDTVTISGSGFLSPDGQITAYFGTTAAPTSCPNATTCSATVPAGGPGPVTVTVATGTGTSNGLSFDYV